MDLKYAAEKFSLVAEAGCAWFVCVDTGYKNKTILNIFLYLRQACNIFQNRILTVGGAWTDDQQETVICTCKYIPDLFVSLGFYTFYGFRNRNPLPHFFWCRQVFDKCETHDTSP